MSEIPNRIKRIVIVLIVIIVIFILGSFLTNLFHPKLSSSTISSKLAGYISDFVRNTKSVRSCVLSVMKGDGSFSWSGAAGISNQNTHAVMTKDTPIFLSSVTKLFTATVIMKLYEKEMLSLDDPISKFLPTELIRGIQVYEGKDYTNEITIKQLLSHSSGIADYYTEKSKDGKSFFEVFLENPERHWTVDETIARARDELKPHFRPGTGTFYSDTNYQLLGKIIEYVTHKSLYLVYEELLFQPLNLQHTFLIGSPEAQESQTTIPADIYYNNKIITKTRYNGAYWSDGGIISTSEEMIVFLKALNEGKIINKKTLKLMHDWHKMEFPIQYGYGTMYFKLPWLMTRMSKLTPLWGHSGSTGSFLYFSEDLNLYIAGSINVAGSNTKPFILIRNVMKLFWESQCH
jgi:D-alanyl-D-alanine carboxypeptidase